MKQIINFEGIWFSMKQALYAGMVLILSVSIPTVAYLELSHTDKEAVKTEQIAKTNISRSVTAPQKS